MSDGEAQSGDALVAIPDAAVQPVERQGPSVTAAILEDCLPGTLGISHDFRGGFWVEYAELVNRALNAHGASEPDWPPKLGDFSEPNDTEVRDE